MKSVRSLALCAVPLVLALPCAALSGGDEPPEVAWEPFPSQAADGTTLEGMLGRIRVPEDRARRDGKTIEIAFVVYPSSNPEPGPPIYYLIGGPGAPASEYCADIASDPRMRLLDFGDVIGIDQRGTGRSRPNLEEGPEFGYELPLERAIGPADVIAAHSETVARCVAHWRAQGVDPAAYDSAESADDVDDVRRALGHEKIVTWGASYGSHLSLAYLRRHAAHVARSVLINVEAPDASWKLPSTAQRMLEGIHARVAADPVWKERMPDFLGTLSEVLAGLRAEPVEVLLGEGTPDELRVMVGAYDLQVSLAGLLADARGHALLPAIVDSFARGDFSRLAKAALQDRRVTLPTAMLVLMDCASGASTARRARIEREAADPKNLLGGAINAPYYLETCAATGVPPLGDDFRAPLTCDVPVLFVSGTLDVRTPPENVEELRAGFARHAHLVVENAAHDNRELESAEYRALVQDFLRGKEVASRTLTLPPVPLAPPR
jgi:pimeloyl-ACP methyl ester carboxylesterase